MRPTCVLLIALAAIAAARGQSPAYSLDVSPAEHRITVDHETGAELRFLTTNPAEDTNLYFHERSWLADSSLILFYTTRDNGGLFGYLTATGELVRLHTPLGALSGATAAVNRNSVFAIRDRDVVEVALTIEPDTPTRVSATERVIAALPPGDYTTALNESCDGAHLAIGYKRLEKTNEPAIVLIEVNSGDVRALCAVPSPPTYMHHVQWSRSNPNLLSFAGLRPRLNVVDIHDGVIRSIYHELDDELVTHEHWWGNDQIVFCGGYRPKPVEDSHVKVIDVHTGVVRILAAGTWWPGGSDEEVARRNYWHCSGSEDARWVAADNWHGDITLIEGKTGRPRVLTRNHRNYGGGAHPHVGWDRAGKQVVFTSHALGDPNPCVATIPESWQHENPA
jgi:hypothetical protein